MDQKKQNRKKNLILFIRIINIITSLVLIGFGIAGLVFMVINDIVSGRFFLIFSPIFMILFGLMLAASEFKIKFIIKHFSFLNTFLGRGVFNFYLASAVFFYFSCGADNSVLAWISAIIIFLLGIIYCVMHCCCRDKSKDKQNNMTKEEMM